MCAAGAGWVRPRLGVVRSVMASRSGFGAAIFSAFARSCSVFCNSASADRIVMAASRLLGATAACEKLLSFAAGHRKS